MSSALASNRQNDCVTLAILTAVGYDYILTFSNEVEYIWNKPWTWVSTLFIFMRYFGLCSAAISSLEGSSFLPSSPKTCEITYILNICTFPLFLGAADLAMILRVWAIYNRSKLILRALLTPFSLTVISLFLATAIDDNPGNQSRGTDQILDFSVCGVRPMSSTWTKVATIFQITEGTAMFFLVIFRSVRELLQMHSAMNQWQFNRYMNFFVKQSILYFFAIFWFSLISALAAFGKLPERGWQMIPLFILEEVPMYTLAPRFIIGIREVYARDVQSRRGSGVDTALGLTLPVDGTKMMFADVEENDVEEETLTAARTSQPEQADTVRRDGPSTQRPTGLDA